MKAKYYLYRNLHTNTFSVQHKQKVIDHPISCIMFDVKFKVSQKGRKRVLETRRKNVHAKVAATSYASIPSSQDLRDYDEVFYNPYLYDQFTLVSGSPVYSAEHAICIDNRVFVPKEN